MWENQLISSLISASTSITFALECVKPGLDCCISLLHRHLARKTCPSPAPSVHTYRLADSIKEVRCSVLESDSLSLRLFFPSLHPNRFSHLQYLLSFHYTLAKLRLPSLNCSNCNWGFIFSKTPLERPRGVEAAPTVDIDSSLVTLLNSSIAVKWWQILWLLLCKSLEIINQVFNGSACSKKNLKGKFNYSLFLVSLWNVSISTSNISFISLAQENGENAVFAFLNCTELKMEKQ